MVRYAISRTARKDFTVAVSIFFNKDGKQDNVFVKGSTGINEIILYELKRNKLAVGRKDYRLFVDDQGDSDTAIPVASDSGRLVSSFELDEDGGNDGIHIACYFDVIGG